MAFYRVRSLQAFSKCMYTLITSPFNPSSTCRFSSSKLSSQFESVGFIGLGNMGYHMANNLIKAGYQLTVHDCNHNVMKAFAVKGVQTRDTPSRVAEMSDVVITMLPSPSHVLDVYTGPDGLITGGNPLRPSLFIDSSTVDPQTSRQLSVSISKCLLKDNKGWRCREGLSCCETFVLIHGKKYNLLWWNWKWFSKICNNLAMAISMLGVSEALALGQSLGIASGTLTKIFNSSSARCWSSDTYNPVPGVMEGVPSSRDYDGGFASKLMAKDLSLAAASTEEVGLKCPLTSQALQIYMELCKEGHESKDFSCVFRHYYSGKDEI
ncbi:probable 3-hydroxyisobutyrate dehydrogenase, mitochondrial isoform X2 [Malania oleifera]|uniref:probable 3-hydroxyisobutyrate dehydrogenase, mitochondrial isoform X2 n=1 Tax=Malania oleifera TaxID=397392 RepID=UPI0025AEA9D5|nr:probable 3-hydroxyisobutyrate dehydrogenase, mitochondrial isoform X2 [Malania oleifera]